MSFFDNLPNELVNKIQNMSIGAYSLKLYNLKKNVCDELEAFRLNNDFYLNILDTDYSLTPELEMNWDDYYFANRIPKLLED